MAHPDVPAEQAHITRAYARLRAMRELAQAGLDEALAERGGTFQSYTERDIKVRASLHRLEQLQIGDSPLVFGRIDRAGDEGAEVFHLGRVAVDDDQHEPLVVDWRAPVAEPFYRATGAHPMGLLLRRHFLTEGRRVVDLEDERFGAGGADDPVEGAGSGPQLLLTVLDQSRTGRMRDIVATVQREQDEIIRAPLPGILVVQGGPGTGKTAVALHRAAYLLYTHRFPLEQQGVLVVGPNPTFLRYIGQVLPSLGESGVRLSTIGGLVSDLRPSATEPRSTATLKGDPRMAEVLAKAVRDRERPLRSALELPYGATVLRLEREMSRRAVAAARRRRGPHNAGRRHLESLIFQELAAELRRKWEAGAISRADDADPPSARELSRELRHVPAVAEALERMWPVLSARELLHDLFGARPLVDLAASGVLTEAERAQLVRDRAPSAAEAAFTVADLALLDEARTLLGPRPTKGARAGGGVAAGTQEIAAYGHIVVDEAQDLTPMQLRMLARRSISGSMTVVGDIAQATGPSAVTKWEEVTAHLGPEESVRRVDLTVNYRTPSEIMDVAARVLRAATPGVKAPESVRYGGAPPTVVSLPEAASDSGAAEAARLVTSGLPAAGSSVSGAGTSVLLVPGSLLDEARAALDATGVPFGAVGHGALDESVNLLLVEDAKGLEFDTVVLLEPARVQRESPSGLRSLYVALTRATRTLAIVHREPLPEALRDAFASVETGRPRREAKNASEPSYPTAAAAGAQKSRDGASSAEMTDNGADHIPGRRAAR